MKTTTEIKLKTIALALSSTLMMMSGQTIHAQSSASQASEGAPANTPSQTLITPFNEIRDLVNKKQYSEAQAKVGTLDAIPNKTPYDLFLIARIKLIIASNTADTPGLVQSVEYLIGTPFITPEEKLNYINSVGGRYYDDKNYPKAIEWLQRSLAIKEVPNIREYVAKSYYFQKDYKNAATTLQPVVDADVLAKKAPAKDNLRILKSSYGLLKDKENVEKNLELLVKYYPEKEYWGDLIYAVQSKPNFNEHLLLDLYRLSFAVDALEEPNHFTEFAQQSLLVGMPSEAKQVLDAGFEKNILGKGPLAAKQKQMQELATRKAIEDTTAKGQDESEKAARASKNGIGLTNVGLNFALIGQPERGAKLIEEGIAKGGLRSTDEALLHLEIAYLKANNRAKAEESFAKISAGSAASSLGKLWLSAVK